MRPVIDIFGPIVGDARGVCTTKGKGAQAPRQKTTTNVSTRLVKHGIGLKGCILYSFWNLCFKLSCEALKQNNRCKREVPVPFYDILLLGVWLINWKFPSFNVNFVTIRRIMDNHSDDMFMIEPSIAELVSHFANWNHSEEKFKYVYSRIADSCFTVIPLQDHYLSAEISICPHLCHIHLLWVHPAFTFYNTKSCGPQILRPHTMNFRAMV